MVFVFPLAIWFGIITITSVVITFSLGIAMHVCRKDVFKYHKFFAFLTIVLAFVHATLAFLFYFLGIVI